LSYVLVIDGWRLLTVRQTVLEESDCLVDWTVNKLHRSCSTL